MKGLLKSKSNKKKQTIILVLTILQEGSSKKQPLSQSLICRTINLYGVKCDRRTIANDINILIELGYNIVKIKGGGCYLDKNLTEFTVHDYRLVAGCIDVSKLNANEKQLLKQKLNNLINVYEK